MDKKHISQHKRLAMGEPIPTSKKHVKAMRGGGAVKKTGIKKYRHGGGIRKRLWLLQVPQISNSM